MKFALAGNPNCGKTTLFNQLTGAFAKVGNWPGVTVDRREGEYKAGSDIISVIDLPGIYSLSPYTPEEVVARNYILDEKPDLIINIIDSTNLERNLYLTTQLLETDSNLLVALNMTDLTEKNGIYINKDALEKIIRAPVVEISALQNKGLDLMIQKGLETVKSKRKAFSVISKSHWGQEYEIIVNFLKNKGADNAYFHAAKILEGEGASSLLTKNDSKQLDKITGSIRPGFYHDFEEAVADLRYTFITECCIKTAVRKKDARGKKSGKIDSVLTGRILGIPIFLAVMFIVFHLTFSNNLFFCTGLPAPALMLSICAEEVVSFLSGLA